jgi:C4-dicarboxylate transporter, DctM subunit
VVPGFLMLVLLSIYSMWQGVRCGSAGTHAQFSFREIYAAFREGIWEALLPVVVLGGIFSGYLALSEAATITAVYVLIVEVIINREVKLRDLPSTIMKTVMMMGAIVVILGAALAFNSFLIDQQVPNQILSFMRVHVASKFAFLIILNVFLLAVGCVLNIFSALVIVVPLIVPIAKSYDVNLLHLGIIFLTNLQIGYSMPPIGMDLLIASLRFEKSVIYLYIASLPFIAILLLTLVFITFFPSLSLMLIK